MNRYIILFFMFLGVMANSLTAQEKKNEGIHFLDNEAWSKVVEEAVKLDRKIFVDCYTSWCGPCKNLARNVFPRKEVGDFFNATFVNVKYDMEKGEGLVFGKEYEGVVQNYPTMLVIDPVSGKILYKFVGYRSPNELIFEAKQGLSGKGLGALEERYRAGERNYAFIKDYVLALSLAERELGKDEKRKELVKVIDCYFNENASFDELLKDKEKWAFFSDYLYDVRSDLVQFAIRNYLRLRNSSEKSRGLSEQLGHNISSGVDKLLEMDFQAGRLTPFVQDSAFRALLGEDVKLLSMFNNREACVALLKLYDCLVAEEWMKAFELLTYIREFEMERAVRPHYAHVCVYIAERTSDEALQKEILEGLISFQAEYGRKMPNFNQYACIALVQERIGDQQGAKISMEKYKEIANRQKSILERSKINRPTGHKK